MFEFNGFKLRLKVVFLVFIFMSLYSTLSSFHSQNISDEKIDSLFRIGKNQLGAGHFDSAVKSFEGCLSLASEKKDKKIQMECYQNLGLLAWNLDRVEDSSDLYSKALALANELHLPQAVLVCESAMDINDLFLKGKKICYTKPQESKGNFQKAIHMAKEIKSQAHELKCLSLMCRSSYVLGTLENLDLTQQALKLAQILNHRIETIKILNIMGTFHAAQNPAYALTHYSDALKIAVEIQSKDLIRRCSDHLAKIYIKFGDFQKSSEYLSEALSAARELKDNLKTATILNSLGFLYEKKAGISQNKKDYYEALRYYGDSLNLVKIEQINDMELIALNNIGHTYIHLEKYHEALHYLRSALDKVKSGSDLYSLGMLLANIGEIQLQLKDYKEAEKLFFQAHQIGEKLESSAILRGAHFGFAKIYEEQKKYNPAISHYQEAIKQIEQVRSKIVLDVLQSGYIHSQLDRSLRDKVFLQM